MKKNIYPKILQVHTAKYNRRRADNRAKVTSCEKGRLKQVIL